MNEGLQAVFETASASASASASATASKRDEERVPFPGAARRASLRSGSGRILGAEHERRTVERASSSLIEAVRQSEKTHSRRVDAEERFSLWNALVEGRWSIVESLERDGRRMLLASRNDPRVAALRCLSPREEAVVEHVAQGRSYKYIAAELGVSISAVLLGLRSALRKLGLRTRVELIRTFGG